jgi:hypothetical protein
MIIDRTAAKLQAKQLIRESQPSMLTAALLYTLLTALIGWLSLRLTGVDTNTMNEMLQLASEGNSEAVMEMMTKATPSAGASLIDSLLRLAMAVVGVGFSLFVMNSVRRSQPALGNLLDGFDPWQYIFIGGVVDISSTIFAFQKHCLYYGLAVKGFHTPYNLA